MVAVAAAVRWAWLACSPTWGGAGSHGQRAQLPAPLHALRTVLLQPLGERLVSGGVVREQRQRQAACQGRHHFGRHILVVRSTLLDQLCSILAVPGVQPVVHRSEVQCFCVYSLLYTAHAQIV